MFKKINLFALTMTCLALSPMLLAAADTGTSKTSSEKFHSNLQSILSSEHKNINDMMEPVLKIGSVIFLGVACWRAFQSSSPTPVIIWGAIILVVMMGKNIISSLSF